MTFVDTNVLLDLVTDDPNWADWSVAQLEAASLDGQALTKFAARVVTLRHKHAVLRAPHFLHGQDKVLDVYAIQSGNYTDLKTTGTVTVDPLMPALGMQTHVVRIRQTSGGLLPPGATNYLQLTARLQPNPAAPNQMQTNDFSYDAAHMTLGAWDHIAVFVNGVLSFGCTPEA